MKTQTDHKRRDEAKTSSSSTEEEDDDDDNDDVDKMLERNQQRYQNYRQLKSKWRWQNNNSHEGSSSNSRRRHQFGQSVLELATEMVAATNHLNNANNRGANNKSNRCRLQKVSSNESTTRSMDDDDDDDNSHKAIVSRDPTEGCSTLIQS
mgnify:CR=1 FL=1